MYRFTSPLSTSASTRRATSSPDLATREIASSGRASRLASLDDREDPVRDQTVRLFVDLHRRLGARGVRNAPDFAGLFVHEIADVFHTVLRLDSEIRLVSAGDVLSGRASRKVLVDVHEQRHFLFAPSSR